MVNTKKLRTSKKNLKTGKKNLRTGKKNLRTLKKRNLNKNLRKKTKTNNKSTKGGMKIGTAVLGALAASQGTRGVQGVSHDAFSKSPEEWKRYDELVRNKVNLAELEEANRGAHDYVPTPAPTTSEYNEKERKELHKKKLPLESKSQELTNKNKDLRNKKLKRNMHIAATLNDKGFLTNVGNYARSREIGEINEQLSANEKELDSNKKEIEEINAKLSELGE